MTDTTAKRLVRRTAFALGPPEPHPQGQGAWMAFCPACRAGHLFDDARWTFNGNEAAPSFTPSMLVRSSHAEPPVTHENLAEYQRAPWPQETVETVCHSVVTDGYWHFQDDCTHELKGQVVPMEAF